MRTLNLTDRHFSLSEAAAYLGKSPRWLQYQLAGPNPPPAYQVPNGRGSEHSKCQKKNWVFKKSELDRWLEQFRVGTDLDKLVKQTLAELGE